MLHRPHFENLRFILCLTLNDSWNMKLDGYVLCAYYSYGTCVIGLAHYTAWGVCTRWLTRTETHTLIWSWLNIWGWTQHRVYWINKHTYRETRGKHQRGRCKTGTSSAEARERKRESKKDRENKGKPKQAREQEWDTKRQHRLGTYTGKTKFSLSSLCHSNM